jgi:hypothetical protein
MSLKYTIPQLEGFAYLNTQVNYGLPRAKQDQTALINTCNVVSIQLRLNSKEPQVVSMVKINVIISLKQGYLYMKGLSELINIYNFYLIFYQYKVNSGLHVLRLFQIAFIAQIHILCQGFFNNISS